MNRSPSGFVENPVAAQANFMPKLVRGQAGLESSDYLRFGQMLLNGGSLGDKRVLSPKTVAHMTSNHLGPEIVNRVGVVEPHREGFGFGLGVAVRTTAGLSAVPGNPGEFTWNGAYGTAFFADPKERLVVVFMAQLPQASIVPYWRRVRSLVYQALVK